MDSRAYTRGRSGSLQRRFSISYGPSEGLRSPQDDIAVDVTSRLMLP